MIGYYLLLLGILQILNQAILPETIIFVTPSDRDKTLICIVILFISYSDRLLHNHGSCGVLLLQLITLNDTHTFRRIPLDEGSARQIDLYVATHNTHKRQTSMLPAEFEPAIATIERRKTRALDRAATGIGKCIMITC